MYQQLLQVNLHKKNSENNIVVPFKRKYVVTYREQIIL